MEQQYKVLWMKKLLFKTQISVTVAALCHTELAREIGFWIIVFNAFPFTNSNKYLSGRNTQAVLGVEQFHKSVVLPRKDSVSQYPPLQWGRVGLSNSKLEFELFALFCYPAPNLFCLNQLLISSTEREVGVSKNLYRPKLYTAETATNVFMFAYISQLGCLAYPLNSTHWKTI